MLENGLWDNDGVLYRYSPALRETFRNAACQAIRQIVNPRLSDDAIAKLIRNSKRHYGDSFASLAEYGFDEECLNKVHHAALDHTSICPEGKVIKAFERSIRKGMRHGILTHGVSEWCDRVLRQTGLSRFFNESSRITAEKTGFVKKHEGPGAFVQALRILDFHVGNTFFVDDTPLNLMPAKELGLYTVFLHRGKPIEGSPAYIDYQCRDVPGVFNHINRINAANRMHMAKIA